MTTTISAEGTIHLPERFREGDAIVPGQRCEIEREGCGVYRVKVEPSQSLAPNAGLVDWLLACPVKDWFVRPEQTETADDLPSSLFDE